VIRIAQSLVFSVIRIAQSLVFSVIRIAQSLVFSVVVCRSLLVPCSFLPLDCLPFFDLRLFISLWHLQTFFLIYFDNII
jgi:hypothetical protein